MNPYVARRAFGVGGTGGTIPLWVESPELSKDAPVRFPFPRGLEMALSC